VANPGTLVPPEEGDHLWDPGKNPATDKPRKAQSIEDGVDAEGVTCFWEVRV
jgi:hypothetical protein